jgi:O-antigen/teichoic acid export membrane protein
MGKYSKLLGNVGLFTLTSIATRGITFLLIPLYTYYLSAAEFGLTDMLTTTISLIFPLATVMVADGVLRFAIDDRANARQYITLGFWVVLASCVVVVLALPLLSLPIFGGLDRYSAYFAVAYAAMAFQSFFSNVARALDQVKLMAWSSVFSSAVTGTLAVLFIAVLGFQLEGFFLSLILGNLAACVAYIVFGRHLGHVGRPRFLDAETQKLIKYSIPLIPESVSWWVMGSVNRFMITAFMGVGSTGLFAAASKVPNLLNIIASMFNSAWNLSAFQEHRRSGVEAFFQTIYRVYNAGMLVATAVLMLLAEWLGTLLLRGDFFSAWPLIPILLLAFYFSSIASFYGSIYTTNMKTVPAAATIGFGALVCTVLSFVLIMTNGLYGAAYATVLSSFVVWMLRAWHTRRILSLRVGPVVTVFSTAALVGEAAAMASASEARYLVSGILVLVLVGIQTHHIWPIVRAFFREARGGGAPERGVS